MRTGTGEHPYLTTADTGLREPGAAHRMPWRASSAFVPRPTRPALGGRIDVAPCVAHAWSEREATP